MGAGLIEATSPYLHKLGTLTTDQQATVTELIKAATAAIQKYCRRSFILQSYDEVQATGELGWAFLNHYPIVSVQRIFTSQAALLKVQNSAATSANVSTTPTALRLTDVTNGVVTTASLSFNQYATLGSLATAIAALPGWSASVQTGYQFFRSGDLVQGLFRSATSQASLPLWIDDDAGDARLDYEAGYVCCRTDEFRIQYTAGFEVIPEDLQQVCANLVANLFDSSQGTMQSETLGDYSYTVSLSSIDTLPLRDRQILSMYRDRRP